MYVKEKYNEGDVNALAPWDYKYYNMLDEVLFLKSIYIRSDYAT